jgi:hypothetical protein
MRCVLRIILDILVSLDEAAYDAADYNKAYDLYKERFFVNVYQLLVGNVMMQ